MIDNRDVPKVFALTRDADQPCEIIGYGLVLPDGSAYSISWPADRGPCFYSASSAEETAALRGADVLWITDQP